MKTHKSIFVLALSASILIASCNGGGNQQGAAVEDTPAGGGQSAVKDDESQKDVVRVAAGSPDHTTLVTALKTAEYVDVLSNAGPFTVFAPTNAAFEKLPLGTVEGLLKPEKKEDLRNILEYHVSVGVYKLENLRDGQKINQVNLDNVVIGVKDGKYTVNGASIVGTVPASNGIVYVVDAVLLPRQPSKPMTDNYYLNDIGDRSDIVRLIDSFYGKVRADVLLGPVFSHVNWPKHMPTMYNFWASMLLGDQTYAGDPFQKHIHLSIDSSHFAKWLELFTSTVDELFKGSKATEAKDRARSIAGVFQHKMGLFEPAKQGPDISK